jgi:nucleoside-diphosphate-sugar epimerase
MQKNSKLLIVGGTGFIGKSIAKEAIKCGFQVTIISKNNCQKSKQLKGAEYISVDVTNKEKLLLVLKDRLFCYVLNLSGYINHSSYFFGGSEVFNVHFNGTQNLINCIEKSNLKCFIQIGSSDEYGNNPAPQFEAQREAPISPYAFAKTSTTHFLQMLYRTEKFPVVILRPFLVYGPGQGMERFIPQIIKGCIEGNEFPVSEGRQLRDFCFISDFVQAVFTILANSSVHGEVINISSGKPISIKQVVGMIVNIIGSGQPQFGEIDYRDGENMALYADISKAKNLLGWKPDFDLNQGLLETINWIKEFRDE